MKLSKEMMEILRTLQSRYSNISIGNTCKDKHTLDGINIAKVIQYIRYNTRSKSTNTRWRVKVSSFATQVDLKFINHVRNSSYVFLGDITNFFQTADFRITNSKQITFKKIFISASPILLTSHFLAHTEQQIWPGLREETLLPSSLNGVNNVVRKQHGIGQKCCGQHDQFADSNQLEHRMS